jgi:hypothetical protein
LITNIPYEYDSFDSYTTTCLAIAATVNGSAGRKACCEWDRAGNCCCSTAVAATDLTVELGATLLRNADPRNGDDASSRRRCDRRQMGGGLKENS